MDGEDIRKQRKSIKRILRDEVPGIISKEYEGAIYRASRRTGLSYHNLAYEKSGEIIKYKDDCEKLKEIKDDLDNMIVGFDSAIYREMKRNRESFVSHIMLKPRAIVGLYKCREKGCNSVEFYSWSAQTKSQDEPATIFRQCARCGKRGKE
jgi:DNA-directed RNA polymerase subunit M/transcription elongation factor TFIIS